MLAQHCCEVVPQSDGYNGEAGGQSEHWEQGQEILDWNNICGRIFRAWFKVQSVQIFNIMKGEHSCETQHQIEDQDEAVVPCQDCQQSGLLLDWCNE